MPESTETKKPPESSQHQEPGLNDSSQEEVNDMNEDIDPENEVQGVKLVVVHIAICLCTFLVGLDFNLIATAIPSITTDFNSVKDVGWYGAAFMIALCASQPLAGKTYTLFSKKVTYLIYLSVFEIGSLVCALAPSSHALIGGRAVAGLGASGVFAGGFTLLTTIIPLHKRAIWSGTMGSTFAIASIVGPVLSGALTQHVTWRWCFYINLPIGGTAAAFILFLVHIKPDKAESATLRNKLQSLDMLGFILVASSVTMLLLPLQWGGTSLAWSSSVVIGLFVGSALTLLLFVFWQIHRRDEALIPPRLFTVNRNPALICAAAFFINGPFQLVIYWLPIWFQSVLDMTPTQSGVNYFPTVISDVLAVFIGSAIVMKLGWWNPFLLLAEILVCIGGGLLSTIYPNISGAHWVGYQIFGGIGYSLTSNLSHLAMQASLPQNLVPLGSSTLLAIISTSCAIFLAIGQTVFQARLQANLSKVIPDDAIHNILSGGATNIASFVSAADLPGVIQQYSKSITQVFFIPAISPVISFLLMACCKWISTKSKQQGSRKENNEEASKKKVEV